MEEKTITITETELNKIIEEHIIMYNEVIFSHFTKLREEIERLNFDTTFCLSLINSDSEIAKAYNEMKAEYIKTLEKMDKQEQEELTND